MFKKISLRKWVVGTGLILCATNAWSMLCSTDPDTPVPADSTNTAATDINPGTPASVTIDVPAGTAGTITDFTFQLEMDYDYIGDLIVTLTSPAGTEVRLLNRPGRADDGSGGGGFGCSGNDVSITFDDTAVNAAEDECAGGSPTIDGTFTPTDNISDAFDGESLSGTWTITATDFFSADTGSLISSDICLSATTTPVTVSSVKTRRRGKFIVFDWQTASEAFNLGFHLWGLIDGQWQQLNNRLIAAQSIDSLTPSDYRKRINTLNLPGDVTQVGLSAVSTSGQEDFYGPFDIGESYGEQSVPRKIDWAEQRNAYDAARIEAGYRRINNRWVLNTDKRKKRDDRQANRYPDITLAVREQGIYRITYEELLAYGIDLKNMRVNKLALTREGKPIPRLVKTLGESKKVGAGTEIIFYATGPDEEAARYVDNARYVISLDSEKVLNIDASKSNADSVVDSELVSRNHRETVSFGERNAYLFALPGNDPWYDSNLRAFGQNVSQITSFEIPDTADLEHSAELRLSLVGGFEFARVDADGDGDLEPHHHFKVYLNRATFPEPVYEGFSNGLDSIDIQAVVKGQLVHGNNSLELELIPDNGHNIDVVFYLGGSLNYVMPNTFDSESLSFSVLSIEPVIELLDPSQKLTSAYSFDSDGNFSQLAFSRDESSAKVVLNSPYNSALDDSVVSSVWLTSDLGYLQPIDVFQSPFVDNETLSLSGVDYVVIADPSLLGDDLQRFVDKQNELGRKTKVVNVYDIYHHYADGLIVPQAIADYLTEQSVLSSYEYVLLVGGHTYNYRGYNVGVDEAPITMIPSFYRQGDFLSRQIPTAVPFVDFDQDGFPDRAIGRWPVRDSSQLKNVVDKTLLWHAQGSHKDSKSSLFIADLQDNYNDFTASSNRLIGELGLPEQLWPMPSTIYADMITADDSVASNLKLAHNRNLLVDGINQGPALTVYSGHGAPVSWGAQRLLNADTADRFTNNLTPTLMVPLACYTTYYEAPGVKSLSEILLTDSSSGAVALTGASLLSTTIDNENFTRRLLREMTVSGLDLGTAVMRTKQKLKGAGLAKESMSYNWVTLGDPTLSFGLPDITPVPELEQPSTR